MVKLKELLDMVNGMDAELSYREKALREASSNNGWYKCSKCGKSFRAKDMDADHITPRSRGGGNEKANLQLICKHCNRSKGADMSDTAADLVKNITAQAKRRRDVEKTQRDFLKKSFK